MRLLFRSDNGEYKLTKDFVGDDFIPPYAILSHTWLAEAEEPTFKNLTDGTGEDKPGYEKIRFCGKQAGQDGLRYFWLDTCCINKANHNELSQAINSMFRWYRNACRCYVYLLDVPLSSFDNNYALNLQSWDSDFWKSRWFTRGWTLQELLAPASVEFFSKVGKRLGDKNSLEQQIQEITGIPALALQGTPLSQLGVDKPFLWMDHRQTKLCEDKVYSLLGIFDVTMPLSYGEGWTNAFQRLREVIDKREKCTQDLYLTDPRYDKERIVATKGGLLKDSYQWIFENYEFQRWRSAQQSALLWIKGDPGKGKTMLLCGIINELDKSTAKTALLSYFFCQATDSRINNATAVLRGLIYMLVSQQPSLISHILKKHDHAGKNLFEDANAWVALAEIFTNILQDPSLNSTYLIIDALDECEKDLPVLLDFIIQNSALPRVKWIVSSRNVSDIEQRLRPDRSQARLSLEIRETAEQVSLAVDSYIRHCVSQLPNLEDDKDLQAQVQDAMRLKANGTFLWVSLVVKELKNAESWEAEQIVNEMPSDLEKVYGRMLEQIQQLGRGKPELCRLVLSTATTAYRPLRLGELGILSGLPRKISDNPQFVASIVGLCGSFLTMREGQVYIIHQSAKEFLLNNAFSSFFPYEISLVHHNMFSRSLNALLQTLRRDMYKLDHPGFPIDRIEQPERDPLAAARYSCVYWVDHLHDCDPTRNATYDIQNGGLVDKFLRRSYLYWLEALSLCKSMSDGVFSMVKLEALIQGRPDKSALLELVRDARRFIMHYKRAIEKSPLQVYASALVFSPARSLIRGLFKKEEPKWITIKPTIGDQWGACLQTLEGHSHNVYSVAFSHDSTRLASASLDRTVKIWDAHSGECLQTLKGLSYIVNSVAFSHDSTRLASVSGDTAVKIWDTHSGECLQTLEGLGQNVNSVAFSHDSTRLASASGDTRVKIWDTHSGECLQTLEGHSYIVKSVAFSCDSTRLASGSGDRTVKIWDTHSGECLQTLEGHGSNVNSVAFSHDSTRLASASWDRTAKIWDAHSGKCLQTLEGHSYNVNSVAFSHDSTRLASASWDRTVKIWDARSGGCLQTLEGHSSNANSVAFSHDSTRLASASGDTTVKIWDAHSSKYLQTLEGYSGNVNSVAFSHDSTRLASASGDMRVKIWDAHSDGSTRLLLGSGDTRVKIWDTHSGECLQTLEGHSHNVYSVAFSHDSTRLASGSGDRMVKIWDTHSGECLQTLKGHSGNVNSVAFSHDSTRLASGSLDTRVKIWDTHSGECLQTLEGLGHSVNSVAFSHDSTRLALGSGDKIVKIWDAHSGECLQTLEGHGSNVNSVAFSHDSTQLASASGDRTVKIWDTHSGECLQMLVVGRILFNISFDPTGSYLHTNVGAIALTASSSSPSSNPTTSVGDPQSPQYYGWALGLDHEWITYNSENWVWLPSEYRPSCSAVSGKIIGIGGGSGKVWMCSLNVDNI